jgi:hypothetical protein
LVSRRSNVLFNVFQDRLAAYMILVGRVSPLFITDKTSTAIWKLDLRFIKVDICPENCIISIINYRTGRKYHILFIKEKKGLDLLF